MHKGKIGDGAPYILSKKNQKLSHKNAIKHKNRGPMNFVTTSRTP
jgi:hypothetical protein